ncbi:MAG: hypothetical protein WDA60_12470 [Acidimicrobiia bacterium]|jgi:hypothetical protein
MAVPAGPFLGRPAPTGSAKSAQRFPWTALGVLGGVGLFALYLWLWLVQGEPVGAAILLGPILVVITIPLFVKAGRMTTSFDLGGLLLTGLVVRFAFAYNRLLHAVDAYDYHFEGIRLARYYRALDFGVSTGKDVPGTGAMRAISGMVHVVVLDDFFASFLVLTWLSFLGCWFFYRAFEISVEDGDRYRYARLILLWPSMCFWPSSLGKDAWMVFTIGVASYGAARVFKRMAGGYTLMGIGLFAASFVRPHLALLALIAFVAALLVGRRTSVRDTVTPSFIAKGVGLVLVLVIGSVLVSRTQKILDIEDFSASSIDSATALVSEQTTVGNSAFTAPNPRSPTGFVEATVTVLFRPFPFEANGSEQLFTALEGMTLAAITVLSVKRLLTIPRRLRAQPYVMFALTSVLLWILAFGVIANFGILARQRTQMLPYFFVLLSVAPIVTKRSAAKTPERHALR